MGKWHAEFKHKGGVMGYKTLKYEISEGILTVTFNRPDNMNTLNQEMCDEMVDALNAADADDNVRVVIFTGAGRAFCAGADLSQGKNSFVPKTSGGDEPNLETYRDGGGIITLRMYDMKKPLIAAINGAAVGGGLTIPLAMDIRVATEKAKMGFPFTRRGIVAESTSAWFLPRIVGIDKAMEWMLSGRIFDAREAFACGLVSEVLAPDALIPRAREIAAEIAQNTSAISVALTRQLLWKMLGADHPMEAHKLDSKLVFWTSTRPDAVEGVQSFLEKRPPKFPMKLSSDLPEFYPWWSDRPFK